MKTFSLSVRSPLYVSLNEGLSLDVTMPNSGARGVSQTRGNLNLFQAFRHAFSVRTCNLYRSLHITTLEVPLLEEKKRAPTRHPQDLEAHIRSIQAALEAAQS